MKQSFKNQLETERLEGDKRDSKKRNAELEFVTLFKMMNKEENNKQSGRVECGGVLQSHSTPTVQSHQSSSPVENQSASQRTILRSYHQCCALEN